MFLQSWLILYSCHFKSSIQSGSSWTDSPCTPPGRWLPASSTSPPASPTQAALTWRQADHSYSAPRPGRIRNFFLPDPDLFCRIRTLFSGSYFFAGSRPFLPDRTFSAGSGSFLPNPSLFCRIHTSFAESGPFLLDPDLFSLIRIFFAGYRSF